MSGSGAGRGRGWLNLDKNPTRPGGVPNSANTGGLTELLVQDLNAATLNPQLPQYPKLLAHIEQLDASDDGILLNQKLKNIIQSWQQECNSGAEVVESFKYVYLKCLQDANLATKLVMMVSSYSFTTAEIHDEKIRLLFIKHIQNDFENCKQLQSTNSTGFRNLVRMLGDFHHKARLGDGRSINFLAAPIIHCLELLLESAQPLDLELFTSQLYLNGASIRSECPKKMEDVLMRIRHLLLNNVNLTQRCRVWMLLALDVVYNRFGLLPSDLHKFYQDQLGDKSMANFQGTHSALSIQTSHSNKSLDGFQSTVSVLQVTPPESTSPVNEHANNSRNQFGLQQENSNCSQNFSGGNWDTTNDKPRANNREKVGRPILGAGARLQKNPPTDTSNVGVWRDRRKENSAGWDNKVKVGEKQWGSGAKKGYGSGKSSSKGWEHDDRFENDY